MKWDLQDPTTRREVIVALRELGYTFETIGEAVGIGKQYTHQLYQCGLRRRQSRGRSLVFRFNGVKERNALERMEAAIADGSLIAGLGSQKPTLIPSINRSGFHKDRFEL